MGVWIEIQNTKRIEVLNEVTPFVGVWIEIMMYTMYCAPFKSLPSWECGLKSPLFLLFLYFLLVTPFVGVWIEIHCLARSRSPPSVTPFVGVWIEISWICQERLGKRVTPFVGVWIEISK